MSHDKLLNEALNAYVGTLPQEQRLHDFLAAHGGSSEFPAVKSALDAVIKSTEDYLYAEPSGVTWDEDFQERLFQHLHAGHPWLSREGFRPLVRYGGWLCWHEGLNASPETAG